MAGRYSPPPHPHPERTASFNPLAFLLQAAADSPPASPTVFAKVDPDSPATHDPEDVLREIRSDGDHPFPIDRHVLKKVVEKRMRRKVEKISFLGSVALDDGREIVARIARRYMPKLKTESEVSTINYIRQYTDIPVPTIYHYDSNPYNRLGGEYILMSKAPGIPLHRQYHHFSTETLHKLFTNLARIMITLFSHRFPMIGSLYQEPLNRSPLAKETQRYKFRVGPIISWPFFGGGRGERTSIPRGPWSSSRAYLQSCVEREVNEVKREVEGRAQHHRPHLPPEDFSSSSEEEPQPTSLSRVSSAVVIKGGVGPSHMGSIPLSQVNSMSTGPSFSLRSLHRPANRRHHSHRGAGLTSIVNSVAPSAHPSDDEASSSSDDETYSYMDYRSHIRSSLLVAHQERRLEQVRADMNLFLKYMTETLGVDEADEEFREFALDMHDLSTANVFVDPEDLGKITCIIDWESTCVRPLWQCAHLPSFLASDPTSAEADLFRQIVSDLATSSSAAPNSDAACSTSATADANDPSPATPQEISPPTPVTPKVLEREARRWLKGEAEKGEWRRVHKVVEWDGWEENLVSTILGDVEAAKVKAGSLPNGVGSHGSGPMMQLLEPF
ncbi:hypothetical protein FS837_009547 [Tulasnella sp. UAMH 9824]|nr:hypothetical protein FS837_009547 [Tulasnella sp. UAMH 9824]